MSRKARVSYDQAIGQAKDLIDNGDNTEYTRGVVELIAMLWPTGYIDTDKSKIADDLAIDKESIR